MCAGAVAQQLRALVDPPHLHGSFQPSVIPVPEDPTSSSDLLGHGTHVV